MTRSMTVSVGPFPIYFGNVNEAMGLRGHHHHAEVVLEYDAPSGHGYPSFQSTNDAIRNRLASLTGVRNTFRDATNEVVAERLFDAFHGWVAPEWESWGGVYELVALHLDVFAVADDIGHDPGVTRYTLRQDPVAGQDPVTSVIPRQSEQLPPLVGRPPVPGPWVQPLGGSS